MIHKERMRFGITLFGKDWGFFYDVHYFEPYGKQATECKPCKPNNSDDILSDDANAAMDRHNKQHDKTLDELAIKKLEIK